MNVYLADLRHNYQGVTSTDAMPLGVGYMKAVMDAELPEVESAVFAYPSDLEQAVREKSPDILMLTNYMWNEKLSLHFARLVKKLNPNCLTIMGGPNIPVESERKIQFMRARPEIDIYATGEGDFYATEIAGLFLKNNRYIKNLLKEELHSSVYRHNGGDYVVSPIRPRSKMLDDIPSPWLTGIMDKFFDGKLAPLFETNRGCPFTCTFCVQGTKWYTKVNYFSLERLHDEIHYIGRKIAETCPEQKVLRIADPNFGMYNRDVEISSYLGETQKLFNWPLFIDATTGKNRSDNIIKSIEKVNGALWMYQAVQSLDNSVLENISRKNIKLDTYREIQGYVQGRGLRSSSDLIIGLPGQSLEIHIESLKKTINSGTSKLNNFQAMMLKGSELEALEAREQYRFETKFRLLPKSFGRYGDEIVFDTDEIVVSTECMPFNDYIKARIYHFLISVFWNESRFDPIVRFMEGFGLEKWDFIQCIYDFVMREGDHACRELIHDFTEETRNELFDSEAALFEHYSREDRFELVEKSVIGDNLMYKYRALASFWYWEQVCTVVFDAVRAKLAKEGVSIIQSPDFETFWQDWRKYMTGSHSYGKSTQELLADKEKTFRYDIPAWLRDGTFDDFSSYYAPEPIRIAFTLDQMKKEHLSGAFKIWEYELKSLPMIVKRIHNTWQEREIRVLEKAYA